MQTAAVQTETSPPSVDASPELDGLVRAAMAVGATATIVLARRLLIEAGQREAADILTVAAPMLKAHVVETRGAVS